MCVSVSVYNVGMFKCCYRSNFFDMRVTTKDSHIVLDGDLNLATERETTL